MAERGVKLDHAALNHWVEKYAGAIAEEAHRRKSQTTRSWRTDETYVKVKGQWTYLYRAVDKLGETRDFMLSERRDKLAATAFFGQAIGNNGWPDKVVIDKSGSNTAGLFNMNCFLVMFDRYWLITVQRTKYLNNIIEQDHLFHQQTDQANIDVQITGFSVSDACRNRSCSHDLGGQFDQSEQSGFAQLAALAG